MSHQIHFKLLRYTAHQHEDPEIVQKAPITNEPYFHTPAEKKKKKRSSAVHHN